MKNPFVSIVVPNYNYSRYLRERLDSILSQTYEDYELIIIDDGSSDDSAKIITEYSKDSRVIPILHEKNGGWSYSRWNEGGQLAKGKYLWFPGADDACHPTFLRRTVDCLEKNPELLFVQTNSSGMDQDGKSISENIGLLFGQRWGSDFIGSWETVGPDLLRFCHVVTASAVVMKTEIFREVGGFDRTIKYCADWKFWLRILELGNYAFLADTLNYFRSHPDTMRLQAQRGWAEVTEGLTLVKHYRPKLTSGKLEVAQEWGEILAKKMVSKKLNLFLPEMWKSLLLAMQTDPRIVSFAIGHLPRKTASAIKWGLKGALARKS